MKYTTNARFVLGKTAVIAAASVKQRRVAEKTAHMLQCVFMQKQSWRARHSWMGAACLCLAWAIFTPGTRALTINEIMYDLPGNDTGREWVEIFNEGDAAETIATGSSGWRFYDGSNHILYAQPQESNTVAAGGFAIITASTSAFLAEHPEFSGTLFSSALSLGNTSDTLRLVGMDGITVSEATYASSMGANGNGKTLDRKIDGTWGQSETDDGTPGAINSPLGSPAPAPSKTPAISPQASASLQASPTPSASASPTLSPTAITTPSPQPTPAPSPSAQLSPAPTPSSAQYPYIRINEFLPNALGADADEEWIEVYNPEHTEADMSGWMLDDADGGSPPFTIPQDTIIGSKNYAVFTRKITGIALNNDTDAVRLIAPNARTVETVLYEKPPQGASSSRTAQSAFVWSFTPTPGTENTITASQPSGSPRASASLQASPTPSADTADTKLHPEQAATSPYADTIVVKTTYAMPLRSADVQSAASGEHSSDKNEKSPSASPERFAAEIAHTARMPYGSFFSRHALALTVFAACIGAAALIRWKRKRRQNVY